MFVKRQGLGAHTVGITPGGKRGKRLLKSYCSSSDILGIHPGGLTYENPDRRRHDIVQKGWHTHTAALALWRYLHECMNSYNNTRTTTPLKCRRLRSDAQQHGGAQSWKKVGTQMFSRQFRIIASFVIQPPREIRLRQPKAAHSSITLKHETWKKRVPRKNNNTKKTAASISLVPFVYAAS